MRIQQVIHTLILSTLVLGACQSEPPATATLTSLPAPTSTPTLPPPTPLPPVVYVGGSVPCFAGPNVDLNVISSLEIGDALEIAGQDNSGDYWVVHRKDGHGFCWVETRYTTVEGDVSRVILIVPTPTTIPPVPSAPGNLRWKVACYEAHWQRVGGRDIGENRSVYAILDWEDVEGEIGYRIYRRGEIVAELGQNETHYRGVIEYFQMSSHRGAAEYAIEAFNITGPSARSIVMITYSCKV